MNTFIFSAIFGFLAVIAFIFTKPFDKRILISFALLCGIYLGSDDFVTGFPSIIKLLKVSGSHWNWTGKFFSLALSALVIAAFRLSPNAVGLTFKQRHLKVGLVALACFIVWGICLGYLFKPGSPDAETLAFQLTMPGLAEELVYRGVAPALLLRLIRRAEFVDGMPWAVILVTSVIFGVWHGLSYANGEFGFEFMAALFPFIGSIPAGWLRYKTGSLVFPILAHGLANLAFHIAGGIAA